MRVAILSDGPDLSAYLAEMFRMWGLVLCEMVGPDRISELDPEDTPVVVCPASQGSHTLVDYARRGGTVICFLPGRLLTEAAGLVYEGEKEVPLRLRVTAYPAPGMAGERFPIVGCAKNYRQAPEVQVQGYLSYTDRYEGETIGITETTVEQGRIVVFAFDLALCVLLLRQGDPTRAEVVPEGTGCARPSSMAIDIGPLDSGWVPFADLLSRLLVDTVRRYLPGPVPLLSHLPGVAPGILLYSGDEDNADVASNDAEFECVAAAGGRMNLYIIPNRTKSTALDVERYRVQHDVGPHPNLRPLDGYPVSERLTEFERQIRMFQDRFDTPARSLRNHCTAWAGYLEPVEVMEKLGVGMDGNYFSGTYGYSREDAPYAAFGGAMPMRFCWPDGRVLNVFQQHTQLADDIMFGTAEYSYRLSPQVFKTVELPFFVEDGGELESVTLGLQAREARAGLEGQDRKPKLIEIKAISLNRLGDTELKRRWAQNLPVNRTHGLTGLREAADFNRPGFAIFTDTYTGAELWLITQGRRSHLQYPGVSYFSDSGKYVFVSNPGIVLRTDGSARFTGYKRKRGGTPWLPAWLQKQMPPGDPDDWVEVGATSKAVTLRNLITRDEMRVEFPTRDGWTLALLPSVKSPMLERQGAPNETLVWVSNDKRTIGLSDVSGRDFREVPVKTHSADPEKDYLNEPFWCKGWDGGWYVGYVLNWLPLHNQILKTPENSINPGQVWALPIYRNDLRGPLYVTGGFEKLQGMRLEDGSVVQRAEALVGGHKAMDGSLRYRMDASKVNTLAVENIETGEVTYIGSYPWMEHIEWSQSWEFGSIRGELAPQPLLFFDLKHRALWPIAVMNFYDYGQRLKDYRDGQRLGTERKGYIFWSGQTSSPDGTKVIYASAMLAHSMCDKGDVYIAVARYPQPPVNVRCEGKRLVWDRPLRHREIRGFNIYRSDRSGVGYQKLHSETVEGLSYELSRGDEEGFYVLTSVEHSGLESRMFSNEVVVGPGRTVRHFYDAETAEFEQPLTPVFDPEGAGNGYALAIKDPDLLYRDRLRKGLRGVGKLQISIPFSHSYRIFGRVRSLSKNARGCFSIEVSGVAAGDLDVEKPVWHWVELKGGLATLSAGNLTLRFVTSNVDIALDKVLVTNDLDFEPRGKGNTLMEPPSTPSEIRVEKADPSDPASPYVKLVWNASTAPQGIRYYSIYRSTAVDVTPAQENLIGSSREPGFVDVGITHPKYYYCVVAVDNWGNRSHPSAKIVLTTRDFTDK